MTEQISQEEQTSQEILDEYKRSFDLYDHTNDGTITTDKLWNFLRALGHKPTQAEIDFLMGHVTNGDTSTIYFTKFLENLSELDTPEEEERVLYDTFMTFDKNNDGYICTSELHMLLTKLGHKLTIDEADDILNEVDLDEDGRISYDDFLEIMRS